MFGVFNHPERRQREGCQPHQNKEYHVSRILTWLSPHCQPYFSELFSEAPGTKRIEIPVWYKWPGQPSELLLPPSKARAQNTYNLPGLHPWGFLQSLLPDPSIPILPGLPHRTLDFISSLLLQAHWHLPHWTGGLDHFTFPSSFVVTTEWLLHVKCLEPAWHTASAM